MLKKILFISLFFLVALFIASAKADAVEAGQAILTVKFQNDGAIGLTVYYNFRDGGGQEFGYSSVWVPANASRTIWDTDEPVNQPYYVSWATDCDDPPVRQQGGDEDAFPDVSVYWATQYVTPTNSCGEPQITTISCLVRDPHFLSRGKCSVGQRVCHITLTNTYLFVQLTLTLMVAQAIM